MDTPLGEAFFSVKINFTPNIWPALKGKNLLPLGRKLVCISAKCRKSINCIFVCVEALRLRKLVCISAKCRKSINCIFVCVEALRPSQPNGVM